MIIPSGKGFIYLPQPYISHPQTIQRAQTQTAQPSKAPIDFTKGEAWGMLICGVAVVALGFILALMLIFKKEEE